MKNSILALGLFLLSALTTNVAQAQNSKFTKATITVKGNCTQCQKRIEEAAYINGVKEAKWNKSTQTLHVVYNNKKTTEQSIAQQIVKAGHEAAGITPTDANYNKLPACCHYKTHQPH